MTKRTPEDIANLIQNWDLRSIYDLRDLLSELKDCKDDEGEKIHTEAYIDMTSLPSAEIPDDIDTAYPVWAIDLDSFALVGSQADEVQSLDDIRAAYLRAQS